MKKLNLNKKGFTLIELLAVIVILAIIMVVTIPTVLGSMNKARKNSLQNATDSVAEWFAKEYELASMGDYMVGADAAFNTFVTVGGTSSFANLDRDTTNATDTNKIDLTAAVLTAAGISNADSNFTLDTAGDNYVYYNLANGRVCVHLTAKNGGSFYVNSTDTTTYPNTAQSSGC